MNEGRIFRYIVKPWDPAELEALVRQAADQHALVAERNRLVAELRQTNESLLLANGELVEANQLKGAFLEVASHEFNTPITLVQGSSELLLLLNPDRTEEKREVVAQIVAAARQLARMVTRTTTVLRADDFRRTLHAEPTTLGPLLREVAGRVGPFVAARAQRFDFSLAPDLGVLEVVLA